jgi:hypothetical protein
MTKKAKTDRAQEAVRIASPARLQQARNNGPHSKIKNAEGTAHSTPNSHRPTNGGVR